MALVAEVTNGNYTHRLYVDLSSQNIAANTSVVTYSYQITRNVSAANGAWWGDTRSFTVVCDGATDTEAKTHDFRNTQVLTAVTGSKTVTHNADGTLSIYSSFDGPLSYVSAGFPRTSGGGWFALPTIPRASTPTVTGGTTFNAGTTVTVNTNRASTGFTHTLTYQFGNDSGTIGTGITDSVNWAVPMTLLNQIPNAVSGVGTLTLTTFSGGTNVGSKTLSFTVTAPSTVVPTLGAVTHSEGTTSPAVATLIGAYVEGVSKLTVGVAGSAGAYGSTITGHTVTFAGQTMTSTGAGNFSGTTGTIQQDGSLNLVVTVTDSRNRTATSTIAVNVLNYVSPSISVGTASRALVGGQLNPSGTYLKVDLTAATTSLIVGTQKNNLTWSIKTRLRGSTTDWASIANAAGATVANTGLVTSQILGTYSTASSYEVRLAVSDKLGTESAIVLLVGTGGAVLHLSKTVDGIGVGKYHEQGSIDALGQMYQNNGELVASQTWVTTQVVNARTVQANITGITTTGWTAQVLSSGTTITGRLRDRLWVPKVGDPITATINNEGIWYFEPMNLRGYVEASISLAPGWVPYNDEFNLWNENGPWRNGRAVRTSSGAVVLGGLITNNGAAVADGTIIGTLPVGFRPEYNEVYPCVTGGSNAHGRLFVQTDGTIRVYAHSGTWISLSNVKFPTGLTWTNATLENSFTAITTGPVGGFDYSPPGHAIDSDGITWLRGNVTRAAGIPADGTSMFTLPVGRGPRIGYQHHHPANASTGFAAVGVGTQGATDRTVDYKTIGAPGVGRIGLGGVAIVSESFTGLDGVISGAPTYNGINGWYPRSAVTPDGLVLLSGLTSTLTAGTVIGYVGNAMRVSRRLVMNAAHSGGHTRVDAYRGGQVVNASGGTAWYSIESAFIADNQITRLEFS